MHFADWIGVELRNELMRFIDKLIVAISRWPVFWRKLAVFAVKPLVAIRVRDMARILSTECDWLPEIHWAFVVKHGHNVVYVPNVDGTNTAWVVDYRYRTVRKVRDVPDKFQRVSATF
jgi:hypothetical protein